MLLTGSLIAGVVDWNLPHERVDGLSVSLYEKKYQSSERHGDPIADAFAIVARPNSCILALADGVNWGIRPRVAARAAILGAIDHLHSKLFTGQRQRLTTQDIFHHILLSFDCAQKEIIAQEGTTTTLTVAMVIELEPHPRVNSRWGLCVVSVGDSPCFLYKQGVQSICEVTAAAHMGIGRDPRDAGGCLGANCGDLPDLSNLVCCFLPIYENDVVFITSDGVSDNFDLVSLKEAVPASDSPQPEGHTHLPQVTPEERQESMTNLMGNLLGKDSKKLDKDLSAREIAHTLITYTFDITDEKRKFLEQVWEKTSDPSLTPRTKREMERELSKKSKAIRGKLDHSTVVAYQIGELRAIPRTVTFNSANSSPKLESVESIQSTGRKLTSVHPSMMRRVASIDDNYLYQTKPLK